MKFMIILITGLLLTSFTYAADDSNPNIMYRTKKVGKNKK